MTNSTCSRAVSGSRTECWLAKDGRCEWGLDGVCHLPGEYFVRRHAWGLRGGSRDRHATGHVPATCAQRHRGHVIRGHVTGARGHVSEGITCRSRDPHVGHVSVRIGRSYRPGQPENGRPGTPGGSRQKRQSCAAHGAGGERPRESAHRAVRGRGLVD